MFAFTAQHKGYQLGWSVSYNGAWETAASSLYCAYIIRKRTIFTGAANHLREKRVGGDIKLNRGNGTGIRCT